MSRLKKIVPSRLTPLRSWVVSKRVGAACLWLLLGSSAGCLLPRVESRDATAPDAAAMSSTTSATAIPHAASDDARASNEEALSGEAGHAADEREPGGNGGSGAAGTTNRVSPTPDDDSASMNAGSSGENAGAPAQSGLPADRSAIVDHGFAEWPMPSALEGSKTKPSYSAEQDTVTDNVTGLVWQRNLPATYDTCAETYEPDTGVPGEACNWLNAKAYCESPAVTNALGGTGWRLPSKIELESLLDETRSAPPMIDTSAFPNTPPQHFWTSTPHVSRGAWYVDFEFGGSFNYVVVSGTFRVRCVR